MEDREKAIRKALEVLIEPGCSRSRLAGSHGGSGWGVMYLFDVATGCVLARGEGWWRYSRNSTPRYLTRVAVGGYEDGQVWVRRVSPRCTTVAEALDWLTPAPVRDARVRGEVVIRQGDVWFYSHGDHPRDRGSLLRALASLPRGHRAQVMHDGSLLVRHHEHQDVVLPVGNVWKMAVSRTLPSEFGGRVGRGD